jgi:signal transduction histidine kinase
MALAVFTAERDTTTTANNIGSFAIVGVVIALGLGLYLLILDRCTPFRHRSVRPISPLWLALTLGGGMAVVATARRVALSLVGKTSTIGPLELELLAFGAWFWMGMILFLDQVDRARRNRATLVDQKIRLELASLQQLVLLEEMRKDLYSEVDVELSPNRVALDQRLEELERQATSTTAGDVPELIRQIADSTIRPLSQRLWMNPADDIPHVRWGTTVLETIKNEPFRPFALILIHVLGTVATNTLLFGATTATLMALAVSTYVLAVTVPANFAMKRYPAHHQALFLFTCFLLQLNAIPIALWRNSISPSSGSPAWIAVQVVASLLLILITSGFASWNRMRRSIDALYLESIDSAQVQSIAQSRIATELAQELSRELHGTVQTKLVACAMASDYAVKSGDLEKLKLAVYEAQRVLRSDLEVAANDRSVSEEIHHKISLWEGLCSFTTVIDPIVDLRAYGDHDAARTVGRVVEEGISNAIRHGEAGDISVTITTDPDGSIRIVIVDDGHGPTENSPGIGSAFLTQATQGHWSLSASLYGSQLNASVPISPAVRKSVASVANYDNT